MKHLFQYSIFLFSLFITTSNAQPIALIHLPEGVKTIDLFSDKFHQIYLVKNRLIIEKYDAQGKLMSVNSSLRNGKINWVDVSNPLRILVYTSLNQNIVFLDNTLSEIGNYRINTSARILSVCNGSENSILYYDPTEQKVIRENTVTKIKNKGENVAQRIGKNLNPLFIQEDNQRIYVLDTALGLYAFDFYGTFISQYPSIKTMPIQIKNGIIYYLKSNQLIAFQPSTLKEEILFPEIKMSNFYIGDQEMFYLNDKKVYKQ